MRAEPEGLGRRERKKAATRKAISDAATMLFLERGFDHVSIREVADAADVSPTTVFAHFPQKEALIFDEDDNQRALLVAAVHDRPAGVSISQSLHDYFAAEIANTEAEHHDEDLRRFLDMVDQTPALTDYAQRMWLRHEDALAAAVAADFGLDEPSPEIRAYARFVIQIQLLVLDSAEPVATLDAGFRVLESGWQEYEATARSAS